MEKHKFSNEIMVFHDWRENITKKLPDNSVDLVCEDIPFGVRGEEWDDKDTYIKNVGLWLEEGLRITKSTVIWFCASRMMPYIFNAIRGREELFHRLHTWDKPQGTQFAGASNNNIWYSIEPILVFSKDLTLTKSHGKNMPYAYDTFPYRTIPYKMFGHPTSKPVALIRKLIGHYSAPGDLVFDGFGGSFSTTIACIDMGRRCLSVERSPLLDKPVDENNPDYYNNGIKRIQKHLDAPRLFVGVTDDDSEDYEETINMFEDD